MMGWKVNYGLTLAGRGAGNTEGGTAPESTMMKQWREAQCSTSKVHLLFMNMNEPEAYIQVNANSSP